MITKKSEPYLPRLLHMSPLSSLHFASSVAPSKYLKNLINSEIHIEQNSFCLLKDINQKIPNVVSSHSQVSPLCPSLQGLHCPHEYVPTYKSVGYCIKNVFLLS